jgi:predicted nucleic acid-binding protein
MTVTVRDCVVDASVGIKLCIAEAFSDKADLADDALDLALAHGLSAYDACYVALARREAVPLVTADERLVRILKTGGGGSVVWLGDLTC